MPSLVLTTWNCFGAAQGLGSFLRWRGVVDAHRLAHPSLRDTLHASDVVCVQELFLGDAEDFFDGLAHPHKRRDLNRATWRPLAICGSGLGIASLAPIMLDEVSTYPGAKVHSERLARKGLLHTRIRVADGCDVDVINTHLQSGYGPDAVAVRAQQLAHLRATVDRVSDPARPCVVVGDLNVDGLRRARGGEYGLIHDLFGDFDDAGPDEPTFYPDPSHNPLAWRFEPRSPAQRLDYVLVRGARVAEATRCFVEALPADVGAATHPSDHFGLRVTLDVSAP